MILGIAGTLGAGKGTVVEYLVEKRGFNHFSVREFLWQEVDRRGLERVRDNLSIVANDLRAKFGAGYITKEMVAQAEKGGGDAIIESLHTVGEAEYLKSHGAIIVGVDADIHIRYKRITGRGTETDQVTFEKFVEDNNREIESKDPSKHNIQEVINMADYRIQNSGTLEELHTQVDSILAKLQK
ncbi:MAG: hypothetical protein JWN64_773 [Parcubacteria group bacterium]|nr:hypothetical protein [Parcubacteria group bacterium]